MTRRPYTAWPAMEHELDDVMRLLHDRVRWLRDRGSDQWSTYRRWRPEMEASIRARETWLLRDDHTHEALGTLTISTHADPEFWSDHEQAAPALYLAKLATSVDRRGEGFGGLLLELALYLAVTWQKREVRMDVWRTAYQLHDYYRSQQWTHLRTMELPHRHSGALFTRHVTPPAVNLPPRGVEIRPHGGGFHAGPALSRRDLATNTEFPGAADGLRSLIP